MDAVALWLLLTCALLMTSSHSEGRDLALQFGWKNNDRNMQIPLRDGTGLALTLHYSAKPEKKPTAAGGTTFIAVTLGGLAIYFVGGAVLMHTRGQTGRGLMVHPTFWTGLPSLVKEGCAFTLKKIVGLKVSLTTASKYDSL